MYYLRREEIQSSVMDAVIITLRRRCARIRMVYVYSSTNPFTTKNLVLCDHTVLTIFFVQLISLDAEGRSVLTEHELRDGGRLVVVNVYCPMVERGSDNQDRMDYKLRFYSALKERCSALEKAGK